ncbi:MAG: hypothetical protein ABI599_03340 [Flavobacteriales bacterium]
MLQHLGAVGKVEEASGGEHDPSERVQLPARLAPLVARSIHNTARPNALCRNGVDPTFASMGNTARTLLLCTLMGLCGMQVHAQIPAAFDSTLAAKVGADERGMRMYTLVLLTAGTRTDIPQAERDSLFRGHMTNISRMADAGQLLLAGPFEENPSYAGIYIFTTPTIAETRPLLQTDPAIAGGALGVELFEWYGSAALMELPGLHKRIQKKGH